MLNPLALIAGDVSQCNWLMGDATDATQRAEMTLHVASVQSLTHEGLRCSSVLLYFGGQWPLVAKSPILVNPSP